MCWAVLSLQISMAWCVCPIIEISNNNYDSSSCDDTNNSDSSSNQHTMYRKNIKNSADNGSYKAKQLSRS